ncbi:hypothetical protein N7G274_003192 [Stereocaulon virgatum]|uniref:Uncharacterized protein n=1 Tax=Stereocaulon virgatum TaxID=373712 RepID=A0ABR4AF93_9LECA
MASFGRLIREAYDEGSKTPRATNLRQAKTLWSRRITLSIVYISGCVDALATSVKVRRHWCPRKYQSRQALQQPDRLPIHRVGWLYVSNIEARLSFVQKF